MSTSTFLRLGHGTMVMSAFVCLASLHADRALAAIIDPGFEVAGATDWTQVNSGAFALGPDLYSANAGLDSTGRGLAFMRTYDGVSQYGSTTVSQVLSDTISANTQYVLSVDVARNAGANKTLPATVDIRLLDSTDTELPISSFLNPTPGLTVGTSFAQWVKTYNTGAIVNAGALKVVLFTSQSVVAGDRFAAFDNVTLNITPVPEPMSVTLAAMALAGVAVMRRRRS
jgi:hypothetical protein